MYLEFILYFIILPPLKNVINYFCFTKKKKNLKEHVMNAHLPGLQFEGVKHCQCEVSQPQVTDAVPNFLLNIPILAAAAFIF